MITVKELSTKTPDKLKGLDMEVIMENKSAIKLNTTNINIVKPIKACEYKIKLLKTYEYKTKLY